LCPPSLRWWCPLSSPFGHLPLSPSFFGDWSGVRRYTKSETTSIRMQRQHERVRPPLKLIVPFPVTAALVEHVWREGGLGRKRGNLCILAPSLIQKECGHAFGTLPRELAWDFIFGVQGPPLRGDKYGVVGKSISIYLTSCLPIRGGRSTTDRPLFNRAHASPYIQTHRPQGQASHRASAYTLFAWTLAA
jgi:hypothetical protein